MAGDKRKKILIICSYPILPATSGGRIRIVKLLQSLTKQFDITFLTPPSFYANEPTKGNQQLKIEKMKHPFYLMKTFRSGPFPYLFKISIHPGYGKSCDKFLNQFDIIQFEQPEFSDLIDYIRPDIPVIYASHNVQADFVASECSYPIVREIVRNRISKFESRLLRRANKVIVCSDQDKNRMMDVYGVGSHKFMTIPHGIDSHENENRSEYSKYVQSKFPRLQSYERKVIFSGSFVRHNIMAVKFIVNKLAPQLMNSAFIINGLCAYNFEKSKNPNVFVDLDPNAFHHYALKGTIGLNPISVGSGANLKILHYLSFHMPVISTEFGMRGYDELRPYVLISPLEKFNEAVNKIDLNTNGLGRELDNYQWEKLSEKLKNIYEEVGVAS